MVVKNHRFNTPKCSISAVDYQEPPLPPPRTFRVQRLGPDFVRPVVEVVVADFCGGRFGGWFGAGVGRGVEGCLACVVDQQVDVACFLGDLVDGALEVGM